MNQYQCMPHLIKWLYVSRIRVFKINYSGNFIPDYKAMSFPFHSISLKVLVYIAVYLEASALFIKYWSVIQ